MLFLPYLFPPLSFLFFLSFALFFSPLSPWLLYNSLTVDNIFLLLPLSWYLSACLAVWLFLSPFFCLTVSVSYTVSAWGRWILEVSGACRAKEGNRHENTEPVFHPGGSVSVHRSTTQQWPYGSRGEERPRIRQFFQITNNHTNLIFLPTVLKWLQYVQKYPF